MNRRDCMPLSQASAIHEVLSHLEIGDVIPQEIYIRDYKRGGIPTWIVREREVTGLVVDLVVVDESLPHKHIAMVVLSAPAKTLGGQLFQYFPGCGQARNMFADIRQRGRQISENMEEDIPPHVPAQRYKKEKQKLEKWNRGENTREEPLVRPPTIPYNMSVTLGSLTQHSLFEEE